jgi:hypothetical protein
MLHHGMTSPFLQKADCIFSAGCIWNNLPASCVFWLLLLQMPGLPNKIKTVSAQGARLQLFT